MDFTDLWKCVWRWIGQNHAVDLVAHNADTDTIAKDMRGKVPGYKKPNGKWVGYTGKVTPERRMTLEQAKKAAADGSNAGVWAFEFVGADVDCDDAETTRAIVAVFEKELGPAPWRGRRGSSRVLGMYRVPAQQHKWSFEFWLPGHSEPETPCLVEWIAGPLMFVIGGIHPRGGEYFWDRPPWDMKLEEYSIVPEDRSDMVRELLKKMLAERGCKVGRSLKIGGQGRRKLIGDPVLLAPSPEHVLKALKAMPCTAERFKSRDDAIPVMCAIKGSLGNECEFYRIDVLDWWMHHPAARDEDYFDKIWDSIHDSTLGWAWLDKASGAGLSAQSDFVEHDDDNLPMDPREQATRAMIDRYVYVLDQDRWVDLQTGKLLSRTAFNAVNVKVGLFGLAGLRAANSQFLNNPEARKVDGVTYEPGAALITSENKANLWRPSSLIPIYGDNASLWLDLVSELLPDPAQALQLIQACAFILQNPGKKINYAAVLHSPEQGIGKDTVLAPLLAGVGPANCRIIGPNDLLSGFTDYLEAALILISEMKNFHRIEVYNGLKRLFARPPEFVRVNKKFMHPYDIPNLQNHWITTNWLDAFTLERGERRTWIGDCVGHPRTDKPYWERIWRYYENDGLERVVGYLMRLNISSFNPFEPPMTEAKQQMIALSTHPVVLKLVEQFEPGSQFFDRTIVTMAEVRAAMENDWAHPVRDVQLVNVLREMGFRKVPGAHRVDGETRNVWTKLAHPERIALGDISIQARIKADRERRGK